MEDVNKEMIHDFIAAVANDDGVHADKTINSIMAGKVASALENLRVQVASTMFKTSEE